MLYQQSKLFITGKGIMQYLIRQFNQTNEHNVKLILRKGSILDIYVKFPETLNLDNLQSTFYFQYLPQGIKNQYASLQEIYDQVTSRKAYEIDIHNMLFIVKKINNSNIEKKALKLQKQNKQRIKSEKQIFLLNFLSSTILLNHRDEQNSCQFRQFIGKCSINHPLQRQYEEQAEKTSRKIGKVRQIPNFVQISNADKGKINNFKQSMIGMLMPINRQKAKYDFMKFALLTSTQLQESVAMAKSGIAVSQQGQQYYSGLKYFSRNYKTIRDPINCLKWYSKNSFFYRVVNKGLRILSQSSESFYLRLPFSDVFHSIKQIYERQRSNYLDRKTVFYRGCSFSDKQVEALKKNLNGYIEMEGFISTSLCEKVGLQFAINSGNTLLQITVNPSSIGGKVDNGFVNLQNISEYGKSQKQVLFNAMNIFKVTKVSREKEIIHHSAEIIQNVWIWKIKLQYCTLKQIDRKIEQKVELTSEESDISEYIKFHLKKEKQLKCIGDIYENSYQYDKADKLYKSMIKRIQIKQKLWPQKYENRETNLHYYELYKKYMSSFPKDLKMNDTVQRKQTLLQILQKLDIVDDLTKCMVFVEIGIQCHEKEQKKSKYYFEKGKDMILQYVKIYPEAIQQSNKILNLINFFTKGESNLALLFESQLKQTQKYHGKYSIQYLYLLSTLAHQYFTSQKFKNLDKAKQHCQEALQVLLKFDQQKDIYRKIAFYLYYIQKLQNLSKNYLQLWHIYMSLQPSMVKAQHLLQQQLSHLDFFIQVNLFSQTIELLKVIVDILINSTISIHTHLDFLIVRGTLLSKKSKLSFEYFLLINKLLNHKNIKYNYFTLLEGYLLQEGMSKLSSVMFVKNYQEFYDICLVYKQKSCLRRQLKSYSPKKWFLILQSYLEQGNINLCIKHAIQMGKYFGSQIIFKSQFCHILQNFTVLCSQISQTIMLLNYVKSLRSQVLSEQSSNSHIKDIKFFIDNIVDLLEKKIKKTKKLT